MRKIAIMTSKGGVGKTTTAVNLAACLAENDRRVLLIDCDTQGQCARALGVSAETGLYDLVNGTPSHEAISAVRDNLHLLVGGQSLALLERDIARRDFRAESVLSDALDTISTPYDYIIFDTAPSWSLLTVNVLAASDEIITPVSLELLAVDGLFAFVERIQPIIAHTGGVVRYVLPTMHNKRFAQSQLILDLLSKRFGAAICDSIRTDVKLSQAPISGQTIFEYEPKSRGAADYAALTQRIMQDE